MGGRVDAVDAALVSGAALGAAQGLVLAGRGRRALALPWALAMPVLFPLAR